ncbi:MAG TPA: cytochrome d ubiquinol oxidase subunit II, partial [Cytophagales bacterium]|nr:cytochrome d ubiquinol oxidase subunit II [Cytophagales bacterium]
ASNDPALSLTVQNASASAKSLKLLLTVACIGTPLVLGYTTFVFYTFRGKVKLDETSY